RHRTAVPAVRAAGPDLRRPLTRWSARWARRIAGKCPSAGYARFVRVLFVKQDHSSPAGLIGDGFAAAGWYVYETVVVPKERFHSPDVAVTFPSASEYDAVVFFGAIWSVHDTAAIPWIADEIKYARSLITQGVPTLGICFGGQMLAAAVGGQVER